MIITHLWGIIRDIFWLTFLLISTKIVLLTVTNIGISRLQISSIKTKASNELTRLMSMSN